MKVWVLPPSGTYPTYLTGEWIVPDGVSAIRVEAIGAGGGGASLNGWFGGGGGAYARTNQIKVTPGQKIYYKTSAAVSILVPGEDSWLNVETNSAPQSKSVGVLAKGGAVGSPSGGGVGGQASACIGDVAFSGGNGGVSSSGGGGGGGGAAGPDGRGANGGLGFDASTDGGGGGGGANGGFEGEAASIVDVKAGDGGNNRFGVGKGLGAPSLTVAATSGTNGGGGGGCLANSLSPTNLRRGASGGMEVIWTDTFTSVQAGPGGGGGGSRGLQPGGSGASYGGGSGGGASAIQGAGLIVITGLEWFDNPPDQNAWTDDATGSNVWQNVPEQSNSWS